MSDLSSMLQHVWDWIVAAPRVLGGAFGGLIAMFLVKDTWPRRIAFFLGALPASYYGGDILAETLGGKEGPYGFICGMFVIAVVKRIFIAIENLDASSLLVRIIDGFLGVFKPRAGK